MRESKSGIFHNVDWITLAIFISLVIAGWFNIYAAVYDENNPSVFNFSKPHGRQLAFIAVAFLFACAIMIIDAEFFSAFGYIIYLVMFLLLLSVFGLGADIKGSKSFIKLGAGINIQPAELMKFATTLALAKYLGEVNFRTADIKGKLIAVAFIFVPMAVIVLQKETGVALVFLAFLLLLYREGMPGYYLVTGLALITLFFLALKFDPKPLIYGIGGFLLLVFLFTRKSLKKVLIVLFTFGISLGIIFNAKKAFEKFPAHQQKRVAVYLGMKTDKKSDAYNETQSIMAIGSGGVAGVGYLNGTLTKYDFVPEQETDFIFCTVGEEWGFLGTSLIIILFVLLIIRCVVIAERQRSPFSRIYCYGVACIFFFHLVVNVGMTIRLVPVIGIPLPLISYGGSSLIGFTILVFIMLRLDSYRLSILR